MKRTIAAALCVAFSHLPAQASSIFEPYTSFVALGDSLTDDGKSGTLAPPSLGGRFSNGITFAEHIAQDFAALGRLSVNLALGGATAGPDNQTVYPDPGAVLFESFPNQIATLQNIQLIQPNILGDNPLVSVLFGANDIFQNLLGGSPLGEVGRAAADAVAAGVVALSVLDPIFDDFVVINLPDLSLTPAFAGSPVEFLAQQETLAFNDQLAVNIGLLRAQGLNIIDVDQDAFLRGVLANPGPLGITNTTDACTASLTVFSTDNCSFTGEGFDISLADSFVFADSVHPTGPVHAAFADTFRAAVAASDMSAVPLPAGLPLLVFAVAALGGVAARRRRG